MWGPWLYQIYVYPPGLGIPIIRIPSSSNISAVNAFVYAPLNFVEFPSIPFIKSNRYAKYKAGIPIPSNLRNSALLFLFLYNLNLSSHASWLMVRKIEASIILILFLSISNYVHSDNLF